MITFEFSRADFRKIRHYQISFKKICPLVDQLFDAQERADGQETKSPFSQFSESA
jgi:hypothetical protein